MYSSLAQGLACGFEGALTLASSLAYAGKDDVPAALAAYSEVAMPEAHAATQLSSTIGHSLYSSCKPVKLAAAALLPMDGAIAMYARINDPAVTRGVLKMAVYAQEEPRSQQAECVASPTSCHFQCAGPVHAGPPRAPAARVAGTPGLAVGAPACRAAVGRLPPFATAPQVAVAYTRSTSVLRPTLARRTFG